MLVLRHDYGCSALILWGATQTRHLKRVLINQVFTCFFPVPVVSVSLDWPIELAGAQLVPSVVSEHTPSWFTT
jgi:hypothetical protein